MPVHVRKYLRRRRDVLPSSSLSQHSGWNTNQSVLEDVTWLHQQRPLGAIFPDAHKMPIAKRLKEWGVDVMNIPVERETSDFLMASANVEGKMHLSGALGYRTDKFKYLTLSHELAHFLQFVEGRIDWEKQGAGYSDIHEWISMSHEADAMRWSVRQAKAMGMRPRDFYMTYPGKEMRIIADPVFKGTWPEEHGVRPEFPGGRSYIDISQRRRKKHGG